MTPVQSQASDTSAINRNTKLTLGIVISIIGALMLTIGGGVTWVINDVRWKSDIEHGIDRTNEKVEALDARFAKLDARFEKETPSEWHRPQMEMWIQLFEAGNPDLEIPHVNNVPAEIQP